MSTPHWNMGVAGVATQNTNDIPSQTAVFHLNLSLPFSGISSSFMGGPIPEHSQHWADYFDRRDRVSPTGKVFQARPEVKKVMNVVQEPQNEVSGGSSDGWRTMFSLTTGAMRNGSSPRSY